MGKLDKLVKLLFYYSNGGFVSGHQQYRGFAAALPGLQQQLQPEHAPQPGQGHGLLLVRVITPILRSHHHSADILIIHLINIPTPVTSLPRYDQVTLHHTVIESVTKNKLRKKSVTVIGNEVIALAFMCPVC